MKLILYLLIFVFSTINNISLFANNKFVNNNQIVTKQLQRKAQEETNLYFQKNKASFTIFSSYKAILKHKVSYIYTWFLGDINPLLFNEISVINKDDCYTKTSWGTSTDYKGTELWKKIDGRKFRLLVANRNVEDLKDIEKYANIKLLDIKKYYNKICYIIAKQYVGFSWYFDNIDHKFYFQAYFYFSTSIVGSLVGGGQWVNAGSGFNFIY